MWHEILIWLLIIFIPRAYWLRTSCAPDACYNCFITKVILTRGQWAFAVPVSKADGRRWIRFSSHCWLKLFILDLLNWWINLKQFFIAKEIKFGDFRPRKELLLEFVLALKIVFWRLDWLLGKLSYSVFNRCILIYSPNVQLLSHKLLLSVCWRLRERFTLIGRFLMTALGFKLDWDLAVLS